MVFFYFYLSKQRQKQNTAEANNNNTNTRGKNDKGGAEREETIRMKRQLKTEIAASPAASNDSLREADSGRERGQAGPESVTHPAQGKTEGRKEWQEWSTGWQGGEKTCEFVVVLSLQVLLPCLSPAELQRAHPTWKLFCNVLRCAAMS